MKRKETLATKTVRAVKTTKAARIIPRSKTFSMIEPIN